MLVSQVKTLRYLLCLLGINNIKSARLIGDNNPPHLPVGSVGPYASQLWNDGMWVMLIQWYDNSQIG